MDGAPGVGKTTITRKVCIDWSNNELLQGYVMVVLVPLRAIIIRGRTAITVADLLCGDDPKLKDAAVNYIQKFSGENVLFIFDGFDELSKQQRTEYSIFLDIIKGDKLHRSSILVTSRPYTSITLRNSFAKIDRHVEVLGFTSKQIKRCIFYSLSDKNAEQLLLMLKQRLDISSLCYIPLNCRIVLFVFQIEYKLPETLTELYEKFILHTIKHHAERICRDQASLDYEVIQQNVNKLPKLPKLILKQLESLSEIVYTSMTEDRLVFEHDELEAKGGHGCLNMGLVSSMETFLNFDKGHFYQFLHLTIQEFLAALYLSSDKVTDGERLTFMKNCMNDVRFRMTSLFLSGLTALRFIPPDKPFLQRNDKLNFTVRHRDREKLLLFAQQLYESKQLSSTWLLSSFSSRVFDISMQSLNEFDCLMIAHFLSTTPAQYVWEEINISSCHLNLDCFDILLNDTKRFPGICRTKVLKLTGNDPIPVSRVIQIIN